MPTSLPLKPRLLRPLAQALLVVERLWRGFWPGQAACAGYFAIASLGLLGEIPWYLRLIVLVAAVAGIAFGALKLIRSFRWPSRSEAERRLEHDGGVAHRPFEALADVPASSDAKSAAAWTKHIDRMVRSVRNVRLGWPDLALTRIDPWAVRHAALLLLLGGLVVGWGDFGPRLARAIQVWPTEAPRPVFFELWLDPPAYTGAAPIRPSPALETLRAPTGSLLKAIADSNIGAPSLMVGRTEIPFTPTEAPGEYSLETAVDTPGRVAMIDANGKVLNEWPLEILPDLPPEASFAQDPLISEAGVLRFDYAVLDDYGVILSDISIAPADDEPAGGYADTEALPVPLPQGAKSAKGAVFRDLTPHRWAKRTVTLTLRAKDAIGQIGKSEPLTFPLPARAFEHPVALAVIAARHELDMEPVRREPVAETIAKIMRAPAAYDNDLTAMTAFGIIQARLLVDRTERSYILARDLMWEIALRLEDDGLSVAERALRKARERLTEAMAWDASPEEIAKLIGELKEALERFLQAMAQAQEQDGNQQQMAPDGQMMQSQDLMEMLDRIRELTQSGARDAARDALAEVDRMLEQLSNAKITRQNTERMQEMREGLQETQELIQRQQSLMDETFRQGRQGQTGQQQLGQQQPVQQGQQGQGGQQPGDGQGRALTGQQDALRRALGQLMRQIGENGDIPGNLGTAERAMRDAVGGLRQGDGAKALGGQGRALEELRRAAQDMAEELARQMGDQGDDTGFADGEGGEGDGRDPLGRSMRGRATGDVTIPGIGDLQRARAIRDEVTRRAGERARPPVELEYLERLLKRF